jgi:hypothetical protein
MLRLLAPLLYALLLAMLASCDAGIDVQANALPAPAGLTVQAKPRCPHCGWIESKREIPPGAAEPRALMAYEYTVRMADGSSRVFQETLPVSWRLRERLVFIDGTGPLN